MHCRFRSLCDGSYQITQRQGNGVFRIIHSVDKIRIRLSQSSEFVYKLVGKWIFWGQCQGLWIIPAVDYRWREIPVDVCG